MKATFGAGCFWGVEAEFRKLEGVTDTLVGYMGGKTKNPSYEDVCTGETGYVEVVQIEYYPKKISYEALLNLFWKIHNPTTINRQGPDIGSQYKSIIFYHNEEQKNLALKSKQDLENSKIFQGKIVTEIKPASSFYKAEEYHQRYLEKRGINKC